MSVKKGLTTVLRVKHQLNALTLREATSVHVMPTLDTACLMAQLAKVYALFGKRYLVTLFYELFQMWMNVRQGLTYALSCV